jgi:PKD repeat protein
MKRRARNTFRAAVCALLTLATAAVVSAAPATAAQPSDPGPAALPSAVPSAITPAVNDGRVFAIAQTGNTMVIGGTFSSVGGQTRNRVAAFNKSTGALASFAPNVNGDVNAVIPGPTANTVYIGGAFTQVNGVAAQFLALLDLTTGSAVATFKPVAFDFGFVNDLALRSNRLYVAGVFTKAKGVSHAGLVTLNPTTGALDPFMGVQLTGHHNDTGSGSQGWVGASDIDVTADGHTMVVIGNFKLANGQLRNQVALIDLTGTTAVLANWATSGYAPYCFSWAFDQYVRGVSFSPDGSYFVVNATGGGNPGTLCDATARFATDINNSNAQPTWVDQTGGDTVWGVTVTNAAVYVGGHNRWENNPNGVDRPQTGAVPRAGLEVFDPNTGRPFAWNPGRLPLGVSVFAFLATPEGVWLGSDTDYIGHYTYKRPKLAFFPYAGGYTPASTTVAGLPGNAYLAGSKGTGPTNVLYRVDAGGPAIQALDNGPDWAADTTDPSPYRNSGSNAASWSPGAAQTASVPVTTPNAVFDSERWSPSDNPPMQWSFPVAAGTPIEVRLYFANRYSGTSGIGQRVFNVKLDGTTVLNQYDIVADVGDQTGTMKPFDITSDGTVNIDFSHVTENPLIDGIEIVRTDITPPPPVAADNLAKVAFDGTTATGSAASNQGIDFGNWRGAFLVGNRLFYGYTDGFLYSRTFDGTTFGAAVKINPYHDPAWANTQTGDGDTFDGALPTFYGQIPNLTGMVYAQGRVYYTLFGDSNLYSRWFSPDSGIIDETTVPSTSSVSFSTADGMFVAGGKLYYASRIDGNLRSVTFSGGTVSGSPSVVSGPAVDGVNWTNRALFLAAGAPAPNQAPVAAFAPTCTGLACTFSSAGSTDPDGTISSYAWTFGDTTTGTGPSPSHTYGAGGTYSVRLTVTDNDGATGTVTHTVAVNSPPTAAFTTTCTALTCSFDASGSTDADGTITSYGWAFGDTTTGTGKQPPAHTYSAAGTYPVTLTVTDSGGATGSVSHDVVVQAAGTGVRFVAAANAGGGNATVKALTLPASASVGDTALLMLTSTSTSTWAGPSGVSGWTAVGTYTTGTVTTSVWTKTVAAGDPGASVQFTSSAFSHASADVLVYSGVATPAVAAVAQSGDASQTSHLTPMATAGAGDWVVSFWGDRSTATVGWTAPAGTTMRDSSTDTGTLTVQALVADSGGPVPAGSYGGLTATSAPATSRTAMWTIVLNAA